MKAVIIELQGEVIHGSGAVLDHDATRMTALQSMGYDVFLVTHDMLNDHDQLDAIIHSVCERLEFCAIGLVLVSNNFNVSNFNTLYAVSN